MPSTPDPNYWGNPPQTPRSSNIPQQPAQHTAPEPPMGAQPATPAQGSTAPQQQVPFTPVNNGPEQANGNYQQVPQGASTPPAPAAPPAPVHPAKKRRRALSLQLQLLPPYWLGWVAALHAAQ